jgi:3-hydroxyisobutyrate dehydrogenase-like beta-hydroxyacid dehydrogenase
VEQVLFGEDGAAAALRAGSLAIDMSTISPLATRDFAKRLAAGSVHFLDAPVSGGQAGAENGQLTVMVGGGQAIFDKAKPVIDCYAKMVGLMGETGAGQLTKMVNQICIAGLVQGLAEGLNFGKRAGLDCAKVVEVISKGAAQSWQMDNRAMTMIEGKFNFGFAVDWMRKDLGICLAEARRNKARLPVSALIDQFYAQVQARGGNRWDTSSLIHLLAND